MRALSLSAFIAAAVVPRYGFPSGKGFDPVSPGSHVTFSTVLPTRFGRLALSDHESPSCQADFLPGRLFANGNGSGFAIVLPCTSQPDLRVPSSISSITSPIAAGSQALSDHETPSCQADFLPGRPFTDGNGSGFEFVRPCAPQSDPHVPSSVSSIPSPTAAGSQHRPITHALLPGRLSVSPVFRHVRSANGSGFEIVMPCASQSDPHVPSSISSSSSSTAAGGTCHLLALVINLLQEVGVYFGFNPTAITVLRRDISDLNRRSIRLHRRILSRHRHRRAEPDQHSGVIHLIHFVGVLALFYFSVPLRMVIFTAPREGATASG